jgi:hypothetical protein
MPAIAPIECDLVNVADGQKLKTVRLSAVPETGDEIDLDLGGDDQTLYRVVRVRYHIRPRTLVRTDDVIGSSIFVAVAP